MIQWASLEELDPPPPPPNKIPQMMMMGDQPSGEYTECNILVIMFIGGVFAMALMDSVRG
jgi:hypothetical protein